MGCFGSKDKLSKEDMDFLKSHTKYDEAAIKEWYRGFKVSVHLFHINVIDLFFLRLSLCINDNNIMSVSKLYFKLLRLSTFYQV